VTARVQEILALMDELYEPTEQAIEHRNFLIAASKAPENEIPYYAAQLSVMLTLLDNLTNCKSLGEMMGHAFQANVAFSLTIGMMQAALDIPNRGDIN